MTVVILIIEITMLTIHILVNTLEYEKNKKQKKAYKRRLNTNYK